MARCATCGERIKAERDKVGARCPACRAPLYEEARDPHVLAAVGQTGQGAMCASHPHNGSVGTCQRCGNFICCVCWTRWLYQPVCPSCVNRALEAKESLPFAARAHLRQASLAVVFGVAAWVLTIFASIIMAAAMANDVNIALAVLGLLILLLVTPIPALMGVGQGAAAIRARGNHMILATIGLILSGLNVGIVTGLSIFLAWDIITG